MNKYSTTVSEEMLIVDEKSRNCFEDLTGCLNPFRLTTYPRICSYYDLKSAKDNLDVFNAVVDVVCFYQGINSKQIDVRVPIRGSGFLVAPPNKLDTIWEYYFVTCLHNTLPFEYEYNNEVVQLSLRMMKGILGKNHRFEPLSTRSMNCTILAKSGLKEDENVKKHPNNDWVLMKMEVPIDVVLDEQYFPESYLIPSPSKLNPQSEHHTNLIALKSVNSKQIDVRVPIRGSGFLVAPPNKLDTIWEYYFVTCLHNTLPFEYEYNNEVVQLSLRMIKGILGKNHRFEPLSARSMNCTILAKSDLKEDENVKEHPNKDWVLMKMEVPIDIVLDEQHFPESYLIPSPSKLNPQSEHDYNMSILSFQGMPTEKDVTTLEQHLDYHTNLIALKSMFELECKNISFGKFVDTNEKTCCKHYNASSFPGSSGGAVLPCCENYSNWRDFKENVILDRSVIGVHTGSEENFNRCCPVSYWFKAFYDHVFIPMKGNFTTEEIERIEMENVLNNI
ncbi:predicted protein [Naegleria gruberi]|uniref:Predicted protein n=1 Tax=Naegleria gruberi TaxID=5762 RepID=D2VW91_NAEGR|nr:uncharacterized protein NAEGRDRAFT_52757 [Naegleria gruberi]EFC38864.1 predicted protein [Naegleria gruberi]|eukprot:XP_002671608.1 predicted protein [Naegleria gruberi strain NEG-M]